MGDLAGRVVLVTGGNSGIGLGMAEACAAAGADVAIWGTNPDKNAAAEAQLKESGRQVVALRCDVGDEDQVAEAFATTIDRAGSMSQRTPITDEPLAWLIATEHNARGDVLVAFGWAMAEELAAKHGPR